MGRPAIYGSGAERVAAFRARKRAQSRKDVRLVHGECFYGEDGSFRLPVCEGDRAGMEGADGSVPGSVICELGYDVMPSCKGLGLCHVHVCECLWRSRPDLSLAECRVMFPKRRASTIES